MAHYIVYNIANIRNNKIKQFNDTKYEYIKIIYIL